MATRQSGSGSYDFKALISKVEEERKGIRERLRAELAEVKATVGALEAQHENAYRRQLELEKVAEEIGLAPPLGPSDSEGEHDTIPAPPPSVPAPARQSSAPGPFAEFKRTAATDLILQIIDQHPVGLTAMEIARRVRQLRADLKVDSVTSQVYTLRSAGRLAEFKPQGGPRIFRPVQH
jgi:hypothetical protein